MLINIYKIACLVLKIAPNDTCFMSEYYTWSDCRLETIYQRLAELLRRTHLPPIRDNDTEEGREQCDLSLSTLKESPSQSEEKSMSPSDQSPRHSETKSQSTFIAQPVEPSIVLGEKETNNESVVIYRRDKEILVADLKEILKQSSKHPTVQQTCELSIWDFAGQSDYYAMHQVFLSHQAVYLLVTKLTEHIDDKSDDQRSVDCTGRKYLNIGDLIEFWLNSIYEYVGNDDSQDPARQNVILVGTHADQIPQDSKDNSGSDFFDTVRMSLADKVTFNLLTEKDFRVNNTICSTEPSSTIRDIRKYILETASKQKYWGKQIPAKWCNLEQIFVELRIKGTKILKMSDVVDLNNALPVALLSDEIELFLRVHHERGNILYYGNEDQLHENVILEPQWLIDAFKSIMTSRSVCCKQKQNAMIWAEFEKTAVLRMQLIDLIWDQEEYSEFKQHSSLILCFMEKLGLIAKPYQSATQRTAEYFVPYCLKRKAPLEVLKTDGNKSIFTSKLCITTKSGFLPNTIFNRLLAACIQTFKLSGPPETKHIYCGCGVFDIETNCHQMVVCFADNVIHIWLSRLNSHEGPDYSECKMIFDFIMGVIKKDVYEVVMFYKCWKSSVESKFRLEKEDLLPEKEVICYCQKDGHPVKANEITKYWQSKMPDSSRRASRKQSSAGLSGQPFRKECDNTLSQSMVANLSEHMKSVGVLIFKGDVLGTVFRVGSKFVMTAYHVVKCIIDPHNTSDKRLYDISLLEDKGSTFIHFDETAVHSRRCYYVQKDFIFNVYLDVAVLEIVDDGHLGDLPPKMVLSKYEFLGSDVSLIGYGNPNKSNRKHLDPGCLVVKPNSQRMQDVLNWLHQNKVYIKEALLKNGQNPSIVDLGYHGYDNESQLMFDCFMVHGASGAPVLANNNAGSIQVVGVFTHGLPEFFFQLPITEQHKVPKNCLLEGGSKMNYIYRWIEKDYPGFVINLFN